ncbi:MAG: DUF1837 domain-containing protein [Planifilum sp.]|jgi:hypothetical protein
MELTTTVKNDTFDNFFTEVPHSETMKGMLRSSSLRLFCLNVRSGKIKTSDLEKFTMLNIGRYVFSRAKQENYRVSGNLDMVTQQALRAMKKNSARRNSRDGDALGEILIYAFLENKLHAGKLLSKIELNTDAAQYESEADGIHFLCRDGKDILYDQMIFGASSITGDIRDAIDNAFVKLEHIASHEDDEILMVEHTAMDRFYDEADLEIIKKYIIPEEDKDQSFETSYGVFLGYSLGLSPDGLSDADFRDRMHKKMIFDIQSHEEYIAKKIIDGGLQNHSFYFFALPLNIADEEKLTIMQHVMEGDVDL